MSIMHLASLVEKWKREGRCPQCGMPYGRHHPRCGYGRPASVDRSPQGGDACGSIEDESAVPKAGAQ